MKKNIMGGSRFTGIFRVFFLWCSTFILCFQVMAQPLRPKPLIDTSVYGRWQKVDDPTINGNGRYVSYKILNKPAGKWMLVIQSVSDNWKIEVLGGKDLIFSNNEDYAVFKKSDDSLFILKLGGFVVASFSNVKSFELKGDGRREVALIVKGVDEHNVFEVFNLSKEESYFFYGVKSYVASQDGQNLFLVRDSVKNGRANQYLDWVKVKDRKQINIWTGRSDVLQMIMSENGDQIAALIRDNMLNQNNNACLYYKLGQDSATCLFDANSDGIAEGGQIHYLSKFSKDGSMIFFDAEEYSLPDTVKKYEKLKIWSYMDTELQSVQDRKLSRGVMIRHVFDMKNHKVYAISQPGDIDLENYRNEKAIFMWHSNPDADLNEYRWNKAANLRFFIVTIGNGSRKEMDRIGKYPGKISPGGKFVVFFDGLDYYSYEIASGIYRNLTHGCNSNWYNNETSDRDSFTRGVAGWFEDDSKLLVYDRNDIWLMDPIGRHLAKNLTNGFGRKNDIVFSLGLAEYEKLPIPNHKKLILSASGLVTKYNGFFEQDLNNNDQDPQILSYGPYVFHIVNSRYVRRNGQFPIKAKNANIYLVTRMSATESPNYFLTKDFKKFNRVSYIYPEKHYNWYTSELHTWRANDSANLQGILYKPENFDSTKKYPLIINFYERLSGNLNVYFPPGYSSSVIDIPTYVSNGYLVFTPDIQYKIGDPMEGTYNSITSATHYLAGLSYIDAQRIGIQGFSFGGVQANYLVANSDLFAAACSASGLSDFISGFGTISLSGNSLQGHYINGGQNRMEGAPWDMPEMYVKNSPIFKVNKVNTPLLMMHTLNDAVCPFSQALEFFTALRRLGKKVWLLEYTDGNHELRGESAIDFDLRMRQFFDHYLMGKAAPCWMIEGTSAY